MSHFSFLILAICGFFLFFPDQPDYRFINFIEYLKEPAFGFIVGFFFVFFSYFINFHSDLYYFLSFAVESMLFSFVSNLWMHTYNYTGIIDCT